MTTTDAPSTSRLEPLEPLETRFFLTATLLKDINIANSFIADPASIVEAGGIAYVIASDSLHGTELWRLDAADDENPMKLVADIVPGPDSSSPAKLFEVNDHLLFFAALPDRGVVLMRSDGTPAATTIVKDLSSLDSRFYPHGTTPAFVAGNRLIFETRDRYNDAILYASDGTPDGTTIIADVDRQRRLEHGPASALGDLSLFTARLYEDAAPRELWVTDGSAAGARQISLSTPGGTLRQITAIQSVGEDAAYVATRHDFADTYERVDDHVLLWKLGPELAPRLLKTFAPYSPNTRIDTTADLNGLLLFTLRYPDGNHPAQLWKSDGTEQGTVFLADEAPAAPTRQPNHAVWRDHLYFRATGGALWRSDGQSTTRVQLNDPDANVSIPVPANDALYFLAHRNDETVSLHLTDGTATGTRLLHQFDRDFSNYNQGLLVAAGANVYFQAPDTQPIWTSDGTPAGTTPIPSPSVATSDSNPEMAIALGDQTYFIARSGDAFTLWRTAPDHTAPQAVHTFDHSVYGIYPLGERLLVHERTRGKKSCCPTTHRLWAFSNSAEPHLIYWGQVRGIFDFFVSGDTVFFRVQRHSVFVPEAAAAAADHDDPIPVWRSDGTPNGTFKVPFKPNLDRQPVGDHVYLTVRATKAGDDLWLIDDDGARIVKHIPVGRRWETRIAGTLGHRSFFTADDGAGNHRLSVTNGTTAGTTTLARLKAAARGSSINWSEVALGRLWYTVIRPDRSTQLWTTDGTRDGTRLVKRFANHLSDSASHTLTEFDGHVYFFAPRRDGAPTLWRSDGSTEGTTRVRRIPVDSQNWLVTAPLVADGRLYFVTARRDRYALWVSDGTNDGTGTLRSNALVAPHPFALNDRLVFTGHHPDSGQELLQTDGTPTGTTLLADILPGPGSSTPFVLGLFNNRLLVSATDGHHGREPWLITLDD